MARHGNKLLLHGPLDLWGHSAETPANMFLSVQAAVDVRACFVASVRLYGLFV